MDLTEKGKKHLKHLNLLELEQLSDMYAGRIAYYTDAMGKNPAQTEEQKQQVAQARGLIAQSRGLFQAVQSFLIPMKKDILNIQDQPKAEAEA